MKPWRARYVGARKPNVYPPPVLQCSETQPFKGHESKIHDCLKLKLFIVCTSEKLTFNFDNNMHISANPVLGTVDDAGLTKIIRQSLSAEQYDLMLSNLKDVEAKEKIISRNPNDIQDIVGQFPISREKEILERVISG